MIRTKDEKITQTLANSLAICEVFGLKMPDPTACLEDRVVFPWTQEFQTTMEELVAGEKFAPWNIVKNHGPTAIYGYRQEEVYCSAQFVIHSAGETPDKIEMDVDLFNPGAGLFGFIPHALRFLWFRITRKKTDPFKVAQILEERGYPVSKYLG